MKIFKLSNLIAIVFKPVIFVAGISLMFIVVTSIQYGMWSVKRENNLNGVKLGMAWDNVSTLSVEGISDIQVSQEWLFGEGTLDKGQNVFSYLLMLLLTLFLMWRFIKLSLTLWGGPIEEVMTKVTGRAEGIAKTAPLLPIWGWASVFGTGQIMSKNRDKLLGWMGLNKWWERGEMDWGSFTRSEDKFNAFINSKLGLWDPWTPNDWKELEKIATNSTQTTRTTFFDVSRERAKKREGWLSITEPKWMSSLKILLSRQDNITAINDTITDSDKKFNTTLLSQNATEEEIATYFTNNSGQNAKALFYIMWWTDAAPGKSAPTTYEELKNITFYAVTDKEK